MRDKRPILLLEDDVVDHILVKRAFKDLNITNRLDIFPDGEAAISHLRGNRIARPCIIILDLNMPRLSGIEFLKNNQGGRRTETYSSYCAYNVSGRAR